MNRIIIAIDGLSSTGKSTFAKAIAAALHYTYLDSGALYRAVTLFALRKGWISPKTGIDVQNLASHMDCIRIAFKQNAKTGQNTTYLNDKNVEKAIRTLRVSNNVSAISTLPFVRDFVDKQLRAWGEQKGIVMDGRDIGSAVFPQAEIKIFMTAPAHIRAQRRLKEMLDRGEQATYEQVLANVQSRDYQDSHREMNPLTQVPDAIVLDNGDMTVNQQMDWFMDLLKSKCF